MHIIIFTKHELKLRIQGTYVTLSFLTDDIITVRYESAKYNIPLIKTLHVSPRFFLYQQISMYKYIGAIFFFLHYITSHLCHLLGYQVNTLARFEYIFHTARIHTEFFCQDVRVGINTDYRRSYALFSDISHASPIMGNDNINNVITKRQCGPLASSTVHKEWYDFWRKLHLGEW